MKKIFMVLILAVTLAACNAQVVVAPAAVPALALEGNSRFVKDEIAYAPYIGGGDCSAFMDNGTDLYFHYGNRANELWCIVVEGTPIATPTAKVKHAVHDIVKTPTPQATSIPSNTPKPNETPKVTATPKPTDEPKATKTPKVKCNAGRGNGSEGNPDCDPGKSGGNNNGGD